MSPLQGGSAMNPTLNLVDHVLGMGRRYQEAGRTTDALRVLTRLAGFRELPAEAAEEAQSRLAELQIRRRKYGRARRHVAAALRHRPGSARYHYLMATAARAEDRGDLDRALEHYRRSLELDPRQVKCLVEFGLLAVRLGETEEGLRRLREAVEQEPGNADAVAKLAKALRLAGKSDEARAALWAALLRNPRSPRFRQLWNEYRYRQLLRRQAAEHRGEAPAAADDAGPVVLPFVPVSAAPRAPRRAGRPPVPRAGRWPDQRHVQ
jgi:tetratricopeptide (TPR) repeat protein